MMLAVDYRCSVCGAECDIAPDPPSPTFCPKHCPDHDYRYDRSDRSFYCVTCGQQPSPDWFDDCE